MWHPKLRLSLLLLLPFSYAFKSRYAADLRFFVAVDLVPSLLTCALFAQGPVISNILLALVFYVAFISVYEIGYIVNDYVSVGWEASPRKRGPKPAGPWLLSAWILSRILTFFVAAHFLPALDQLFWGFYLCLIVVFAAHNFLKRLELKFCTFYWLSISRFVAPTFFLLSPSDRPSLLLAATVLYSTIRSLSYLDSKGMLSMPGRKSSSFRLAYYTAPLPLVVALGWSPFTALTIYFFLLAVLVHLISRRREAG